MKLCSTISCGVSPRNSNRPVRFWAAWRGPDPPKIAFRLAIPGEGRSILKNQVQMSRLETGLAISKPQGRRYRRFQLAFPVRITVLSEPAGTDIETVSTNVSVGGLLVRSTVPLIPNTPVAFVLTVHGEQGLRPIHLVGEGEVVRVDPQYMDGAEASFALAVRCNTPVMQLEKYLPT